MTTYQNFNSNLADELIFRQLQQLPEALKREVLDFIQSVVEKHKILPQKTNQIQDDSPQTHFASEQILAQDWLTETEDQAWQNL